MCKTRTKQAETRLIGGEEATLSCGGHIRGVAPLPAERLPSLAAACFNRATC